MDKKCTQAIHLWKCPQVGKKRTKGWAASLWEWAEHWHPREEMLPGIQVRPLPDCTCFYPDSFSPQSHPACSHWHSEQPLSLREGERRRRCPQNATHRTQLTRRQVPPWALMDQAVMLQQEREPLSVNWSVWGYSHRNVFLALCTEILDNGKAS